MNVFALDSCPQKAAHYHCDRHVVKMILESAQLLCTAFQLQNIEAPYRKTHQNHPSAIWARISRANFNWLTDLSFSLCNEYTNRYNKIHKSQEVIKWSSDNADKLSFDSSDLTDFSIAISQTTNCRKLPFFESLSSIEKYRWYYVLDKPFADWKFTSTPNWFQQYKQIKI